MQCRPPVQKSRESRRVRTKSLESVLVHLDDPWQPASSTVMKTRLLTSVSEESLRDVGIGPSKSTVDCEARETAVEDALPGSTGLRRRPRKHATASGVRQARKEVVAASSLERSSSHRLADPIVIRLFPATGKIRPATTATESKTTEGRTAFCRCACGERRVRPTTSTGTDTETDQVEVKRQDSRICIGGAGPVENQAATPAVFSEPPVVRTRVDEKQRAVIEPPVSRAQSRDSTRAAFHKVAKACSRPRQPEVTRFCNKDRLLTWTIGAGLMVGSLLIALLLLVVVGYREERNDASKVPAAQPKKIAPTKEIRKACRETCTDLSQAGLRIKVESFSTQTKQYGHSGRPSD
ncbi:uncharacterized protein LOC142588718 [Dermacentor variabilis]|uniref:uncharacterized protein LOC142588718 n=1 Tax=Dermacentor variabilis TaxID=34621 RepID=UPI003F5B0BE5